jgi:outer membrane protein OmpA-like peptidoglycan-associated protein
MLTPVIASLMATAAIADLPCPDGRLVPPSQRCPSYARFELYFDWDSIAITPASAAEIDRAQANARETGERIRLRSYSDRSGTETYNLLLSHRRAEAVRDDLVRRGIPADRIEIEALGESYPSTMPMEGSGPHAPLIPTEDGVREPANRRVEIQLRPAD